MLQNVGFVSESQCTKIIVLIGHNHGFPNLNLMTLNMFMGEKQHAFVFPQSLNIVLYSKLIEAMLLGIQALMQ